MFQNIVVRLKDMRPLHFDKLSAPPLERSQLPFWAPEVSGSCEAKYNPDPETSGRDGTRVIGMEPAKYPTACIRDSQFQEFY